MDAVIEHTADSGAGGALPADSAPLPRYFVVEAAGRWHVAYYVGGGTAASVLDCPSRRIADREAAKLSQGGSRCVA